MANNLDKSNLGYLGTDFQYSLTKVMMDDPAFVKELFPIIDENVFTVQILRKFINVLKDYYRDYSDIPSYETIRLVIASKASCQTDIDEIDALIAQFKQTPVSGVDIIKNNAIRFFKQQQFVKIANRILELTKNGDIEKYDECQKLFNEAVMAGGEEDFGCSPYDLEKEALSQTFKVPIPTGIAKLDEALNGGLEKGKMGLIIGSAGFGKTSLTTCIASNAARYLCDLNNHEGFKVLQIFFEDDKVDIARKHFAKISQYESRELTKNEANIHEVRELIDNYEYKDYIQKNLRMVRFNTNTKSASDIEIYIKRLINSGFRPDLVIIDYFECLTPEKGGYSTDTEWSREGITMRKLENMAKDMNIAIWVPTQGNKGSITSPEVVTMDQAGGSIKKVQVAQVVISIARSLEDIDNNKATVAVLKNRSGKSGNIFRNIVFNNGTCTISCDETEDFNSTLMYNDRVNEIAAQQQIELARQCKNYQSGM